MGKNIMPAGRPTDYDPSFPERLIRHMSQGLSFESFAGEVGTGRTVLYDWLEKYPEFLDAKKQGTEYCLRFWESMGVAGAAGKIKNFNCAAWIFNMKNRFRKDWHDRQQIEYTAPEPIVIERPNGDKVILGVKKEDAE